ncbi:MAG TPA: aldo/keto reductase [Gammaproteobacteria bacterium]|nr:aldo/keto reductase [Gammaproteobacteria bacterium]
MQVAIRNESGTFNLGGDLEVRRLGYGAMQLPGPGVWGEPPDPAKVKRTLKRVPEVGINLIDTADSYGPEVSERLIAEVLHPYPADLVIATKGGLLRPGPGKWKPNGRPEHLRAACEGSLRRLRLDCIDLYQLHRIDREVPLEDSLGALKDLQDAGKIRHIGLSEVGIEEIKQARKLVPIVSVQNRYNVADRQWDDVLDYCEAEGIAFVPWFPLETGKLATDEKLAAIADARGVTRAQVALAWLLKRSPAMLPIPGTSSVEHLEENVAATSLELSDEEMRSLSA